MATSTTKDGAVRREKRGTSPSTSSSNSQTSQRRSASAGRTSSTSSATLSTSDKPIPNYLKPTISSRHDSFKFVKKNEDNKLLRRRSFDKPPPSSPRIQKALVSPGPRDRQGGAGPALREKTITVRSKSISSKSTANSSSSSSTKHVLDTKVISKLAPKPIKSQSFSRTGKKGVGPSSTTHTTPAGKNSNKDNNNKESRNNNNSKNDNKEEDHIAKESKEHSIEEHSDNKVDDVAEEMVKVEREVHQDIPKSVEEHSDNTKLDDKKDEGDDNIYDKSIGEEEKIKTCDVSATPSDQDDVVACQSTTTNTEADQETDHQDEDNQNEGGKTIDGEDLVEEREEENPGKDESDRIESRNEKDDVKAAEESSAAAGVVDDVKTGHKNGQDVDHEVKKDEEEKGKSGTEDDLQVDETAKTDVEIKEEEQEITDICTEEKAGGHDNETNKEVDVQIQQEEEEKPKEEVIANNNEVEVKGESEDDNQMSQKIDGTIDDGKQPSKTRATETEAETENKNHAGGNKKESPGAYNDVIEETASKLLEKRKNKVRALVGAFETVIDYESVGNSSK